MPDRSYAAALAVGLVTAAVFAPALGGELVGLDGAAPGPVVATMGVGANVALHAVDAALVTLLLARLSHRLLPSVLAATLFALHPLRVESLVWTSAVGPAVVGFTAVLLALLAYEAWARAGGWWRYAAAVGVYAVGVAAYAVGVAATPLMAPVPVLLLLLDAWPLGRLDVAAPGRDARCRRRLGEKLPFAVLALAALVITPPAGLLPPAGALGPWVANAFATVARYVGAVLVPVALTPLPVVTAPPWWAPGAVIAVAALTAAVLAVRMRVPALALGWLWFLVALLPVLGRAPGDRFTGLPSLGPLLALAALVGALARSSRRAGAVATLVAMAAACLVATERQLAHWRDDETVFRHALAVTEDNLVAERGLAARLVARGAWDEAAIHASAAVRLGPDDPEARNSLGEVRLHEGHVDAAAEHFAAASAARPDLLRPRYNLARAEQQRGRLDEAIAGYREVLALAPDDAMGHAGLARAFRQRGELAAARAHFERALALGAPPATVLGALAQTLAEAGDLDAAVARYRALLALTPDDAVAHHRLGTLGARRGELEVAEAEYRTALRLRPDLADAQLHLGIVLAARGALGEALAAYDAALGLAPRLASAQYNRALVLEAMGDRGGARAALRAELELQPDWPPALVRLAAVLAVAGDEDRAEARRLADRAAASLGADDPEVAAVRRLVDRPSVTADSP